MFGFEITFFVGGTDVAMEFCFHNYIKFMLDCQCNVVLKKTAIMYYSLMLKFLFRQKMGYIGYKSLI